MRRNLAILNAGACVGIAELDLHQHTFCRGVHARGG
jgi:hypothetical protein